jgi:hypothetical protein
VQSARFFDFLELYPLPVNLLTREPSILGSFITINLTWSHLHLSKLSIPIIISANPSKKNQTQGGVYTIISNNPKTINKMDSRLGFPPGL